MQYILSEEEMAAIRNEREALRKIPCHSELVIALENVCKMVASTMIPTEHTSRIGKRDKPYGCIHVNPRESYGYCDKCPVQGICPLPKDYSK